MIVSVVSGKGGTGKTTAVSAIGSCLAACGHKTLVLDADIGLKNLDLSLGLSNMAVRDFSDVLENRLSAENAPCEHPDIENLYFLSAPTILQPEDIDTAAFANLMREYDKLYEYVIIDAPAGIGRGFELALSAAKMAIVVATSDTSSLRDGQRVVTRAFENGVEDVRVLVNRVKPRVFIRTRSTVDDIIDTVGAQLIGLISEDPAVSVAANLEIPLVLYESRKAADQFFRVAKRIAGERIVLGSI